LSPPTLAGAGRQASGRRARLRLGSGLQACRAPRAAAEALATRRERPGPQGAIVGARRLAHPQLHALGPYAIAAPALGARDVAGGALRLLLDLGEERRARFDRSALIARRRRDARIARPRIPVGIGVRVGCLCHRTLDARLPLVGVPV